MGNPETQATLSTKHRMKTQKKQNKSTTQKRKKMNKDPAQKLGMNPGAREGQSVTICKKIPPCF